MNLLPMPIHPEMPPEQICMMALYKDAKALGYDAAADAYWLAALRIGVDHLRKYYTPGT